MTDDEKKKDYKSLRTGTFHKSEEYKEAYKKWQYERLKRDFEENEKEKELEKQKDNQKEKEKPKEDKEGWD